MINIKTVLEKHGLGMDSIVKCTIFMENISDWSLMNIAYLGALGNHRPARSALGTYGLASGSLVEIECIAAR